MSSIVNVESTSPDCALELSIIKCRFSHDHIQSIIKQSSKLGVQWRQLVSLSTANTVISSNVHNEGHSLISMYNGEITLRNTTITNNTYFESIISLSLSCMTLFGRLDISSNCARHVLSIMEISYILMFLESIFVAVNNTMYSVLTWEITYKEETNPLCYFQFNKLKFPFSIKARI